MAIELSTAGIKIGYAVETTAGTRPTSGYTVIPCIKSIPSLNPAPDTLETTDLSVTGYKTYIDGLKDLGGALTFTANLTQDFVDKWAALVTAYKTGKEESKQTWFCVNIPGISKDFYFRGNPSEQGLPAAEVNQVLETEVFITPTSVDGWQTAATTWADGE